MAEKTCTTCKSLFTSQHGTFCRRYPPTNFIVGTQMGQPIVAAFFPPITSPEQTTCDEHRVKIAEVVAAEKDSPILPWPVVTAIFSAPSPTEPDTKPCDSA